MRIIIAPARKMHEYGGYCRDLQLPMFLERTEILKEWICGLSFEEKKELWSCSDAITRENEQRFIRMNLREPGDVAILTYEGVQYQYMQPRRFTEDQLWYVERNLRILSGFYGVLCPLDGIVPYRLEMQAKVRVDGYRNLYEFWGDCLYRAVRDESGILLNLASKEYAKCIEKYLVPADRYVTCVFGTLKDGKIVQIGAQAKMARGQMVRFMAERNVQEPEEIKVFSEDGYVFAPERSTDREYVFLR